MACWGVCWSYCCWWLCLLVAPLLPAAALGCWASLFLLALPFGSTCWGWTLEGFSWGLSSSSPSDKGEEEGWGGEERRSLNILHSSLFMFLRIVCLWYIFILRMYIYLFVPFNGKFYFGKGLPPIFSSIFLGRRVCYLLVGGTFILCCKKMLEDFYSPKLFFYITAFLLGQSLPLHNASGSFRTGSFSVMCFFCFVCFCCLCWD